jgi:solute carrier family 25 phosphate transporter 3
MTTFFTGWSPTFVGNFISGGAQYAAVEIFRRTFIGTAGLDAAQLEVPIILLASGLASAIAGIIYCPFEAVRIRMVAQPDYAANSFRTLQRILEEEGVQSLTNTIPIFLLKYVPYAMTKFTVFDISTARLYEAFPSAREELSLALLISLAGGILGGTAASIISNPSDCVISELKKSKTEASFLDAVNSMRERGGIRPFFAGLPLRIVRYSTIASLSFVTYDAIRFSLGIGADDLKLYLDVLGGALQQ